MTAPPVSPRPPAPEEALELLRAALREALPPEPAGLAGVALLSQPDMPTLQLAMLEVGSPEAEDPELRLLANEWEQIHALEVLPQLLPHLVPPEGTYQDDEDGFLAFARALDECCLGALEELRPGFAAGLAPPALLVYTRLDASGEEYCEWFRQLNGEAHLEELAALL